MSEVLERIVVTKEAAHQAATLAYQHAQTLLLDGKRVKITAGEDQDTLSIKQRKFLHGPVFGQISEQVRVGEKGERFVMDVWKEYYRKLFLEAEPQWEMVKLPGQKRATPRRVRKSTEDLTVKQYSEHIDKVIAHAATEWGVVFHFIEFEREEVRYRPPARKRLDEAQAA